ncbi:beta-sandwich lipoprotein [Lysinibacter cavernae]|uniref:beta-sandwich lipoprotein n=1 Tax=Lysinibacter cavernae TaxID=1640652 RepID=UPI00361A5653
MDLHQTSSSCCCTLVGGASLAGCSSDAKVASENLSVAADNFEVQRLIVGVNGITDEILFSVEGRCSIERDGDLVVTCKHGENDYRKHYLGLSDNVSWVSTQLEGIDVSVYHTRIILKSENILADFDLSTGVQ